MWLLWNLKLCFFCFVLWIVFSLDTIFSLGDITCDGAQSWHSQTLLLDKVGWCGHSEYLSWRYEVRTQGYFGGSPDRLCTLLLSKHYYNNPLILTGNGIKTQLPVWSSQNYPCPCAYFSGEWERWSGLREYIIISFYHSVSVLRWVKGEETIQDHARIHYNDILDTGHGCCVVRGLPIFRLDQIILKYRENQTSDN